MLDSQSSDTNNSVHFTTVQSLSKSDFERLKQTLLDFIEKSAATAAPSEPEELVCLSCDFFSV